MALEVLVVDDLELRPYGYAEHLETGGLLAHCFVRLGRTDSERLEDLIAGKPRYMRVLRVGLDDEPREMRFGRCTWSLDAEHVKHHLVLVERASDDGQSAELPWPFEHEAIRTREALAELQGVVDGLLEHVTEAGLLSSEQAGELREGARTSMPRRLRQFLRFDDVDEELGQVEDDDEQDSGPA